MFVCCVYLQCNECSLMNLWLRCFRVDISVCFFLLLSFFYRMRSPIWITKQKSIFMKHGNLWRQNFFFRPSKQSCECMNKGNYSEYLWIRICVRACVPVNEPRLWYVFIGKFWSRKFVSGRGETFTGSQKREQRKCGKEKSGNWELRFLSQQQMWRVSFGLVNKSSAKQSNHWCSDVKINRFIICSGSIWCKC